MKKPNLDREINDLAYYENNDELTEQGKNTINEFREIKEQLILYGVVKSFYCYEELDEKLPRCSKQCVVCRSASRNLQ